MFNCTLSWNWKEVPNKTVFRIILKRILKAYFRLISSLMKSHSNSGKFSIKYKIGLTLFLFFISGTQNIWCIAHSMYCRIWGNRKINKFILDRKYIPIYQSISNQSEKVLLQISALRIWRPLRKFGYEMNSKGLLYLALIGERLK